MENVFEAKKILRKNVKEKVAFFLAHSSVKKESEDVCRAFYETENVSSLFEKSDVFLAYIPSENECDCRLIICDAMAKGKTVAVPKVHPGTNEMDFFILKNEETLENQLEKGSFGIFEPKQSLKKLELTFPVIDEKKVFVLVPGLAFSSAGKRLGHGKGFYDRYIPRLKKAFKCVFLCGFCFPCQFFDEKENYIFENTSASMQNSMQMPFSFPVDEFDILMDAVVF